MVEDTATHWRTEAFLVGHSELTAGWIGFAFVACCSAMDVHTQNAKIARRYGCENKQNLLSQPFSFCLLRFCCVVLTMPKPLFNSPYAVRAPAIISRAVRDRCVCTGKQDRQRSAWVWNSYRGVE